MSLSNLNVQRTRLTTVKMLRLWSVKFSVQNVKVGLKVKLVCLSKNEASTVSAVKFISKQNISLYFSMEINNSNFQFCN